MPTKWINYRDLKDRLSFEAVLRHYGVEPQLKPGNQHMGFCPLPGHNGQRKSPSFSANLETKIFQCFGCGGKGNILEFAVLMEGADPADKDEFRRIAVKIDGVFSDGVTAPPSPTLAKSQPKAVAEEKPTPGALLNPPLDFELKSLDTSHGYLTERRIEPETAAHFGLGVCLKGLMANRLAIPLRSHSGELIGYAGRLIDEADAKTPRYKFPAPREKEGQRIEFHKSLFLYNGHSFTEPVEELIIVEGFPSVWWLWQLGWKAVVATMGAAMSDEQARLATSLVTQSGRIWVMPDADNAGERFGGEAVTKLAPWRWCRWCRLQEGQQPTDLDHEGLAQLLTP